VTASLEATHKLGPMPLGRPMETVDERVVRAPTATIFRLAREVEAWPSRLPHYRFVRYRERDLGGGGIVEMAANRRFMLPKSGTQGLKLDWPTWWLSIMEVDHSKPAIRFRHIGGITTGMDVEWSFVAAGAGTRVRIVHAWDGPRWPLIGIWAATAFIGPVFVQGIASQTLAGLAQQAERETQTSTAGRST
jgi:Polyketide cyclase / dehydrase and lipid transport